MELRAGYVHASGHLRPLLQSVYATVEGTTTAGEQKKNISLACHCLCPTTPPSRPTRFDVHRTCRAVSLTSASTLQPLRAQTTTVQPESKRTTQGDLASVHERPNRGRETLYFPRLRFVSRQFDPRRPRLRRLTNPRRRAQESVPAARRRVRWRAEVLRTYAWRPMEASY